MPLGENRFRVFLGMAAALLFGILLFMLWYFPYTPTFGWWTGPLVSVLALAVILVILTDSLSRPRRLSGILALGALFAFLLLFVIPATSWSYVFQFLLFGIFAVGTLVLLAVPAFFSVLTAAAVVVVLLGLSGYRAFFGGPTRTVATTTTTTQTPAGPVVTESKTVAEQTVGNAPSPAPLPSPGDLSRVATLGDLQAAEARIKNDVGEQIRKEISPLASTLQNVNQTLTQTNVLLQRMNAAPPSTTLASTVNVPAAVQGLAPATSKPVLSNRVSSTNGGSTVIPLPDCAHVFVDTSQRRRPVLRTVPPCSK
jgi:hypothetical protein